jgi:hypothetical protein
MASWCNKVKQGVNTVITESWVTLDSVFFCKNIVILALQVPNNFLETISLLELIPLKSVTEVLHDSYHFSLSILSPNPGVSTIVNEILSEIKIVSHNAKRRAKSDVHDIVPDTIFVKFCGE